MFEYDVILGLVAWEFKPQQYHYSIEKNQWVIFNGGRKKVKLRNYIHEKADIIASFSKSNVIQIKKLFIEAYNLGGIPAVDRAYQATVDKLIESHKKIELCLSEKLN